MQIIGIIINVYSIFFALGLSDYSIHLYNIQVPMYIYSIEYRKHFRGGL